MVGRVRGHYLSVPFLAEDILLALEYDVVDGHVVGATGAFECAQTVGSEAGALEHYLEILGAAGGEFREVDPLHRAAVRFRSD